MPRTVKVAIVGSGLAGLTAAHLLSRPLEEDVQMEIHLFEKAPVVGMDASSVSLAVPGLKNAWRVDVPMRSFQGGYYPRLIALYKSLGVAFRQADFSYSFSLFTPKSPLSERTITTTMIYNGASGRAGISMPTRTSEAYRLGKDFDPLFRTMSTIYAWAIFIFLSLQLVICYARTVYLALPVRRQAKIKTMTFNQWVNDSTPNSMIALWLGLDHIWSNYAHDVLIPLFSAVCTAPESDINNHPIEEFLDYVWLTFGTHHYVVSNGVQDVVARLSAAIDHIHLSSPIVGIQRNSKGVVSITCATINGTKIHTDFSHIILATQASSAIPLLRTYASSLSEDAKTEKQAIQAQIQCLKSFQYRPTIVINHTDNTLLPDGMSDRRDLNLINIDNLSSYKENLSFNPLLCVSPSYTMATQVLPRPTEYPTHLPDIYQTTNPIIPPKEATVLSVAKLERAILTVEAKEALVGLCKEKPRRWWQCAVEGDCALGTVQGAGRLEDHSSLGIWICGSYAYIGIPLLEGCVGSARNVVENGVYTSEGIRARNPPCT